MSFDAKDELVFNQLEDTISQAILVIRSIDHWSVEKGEELVKAINDNLVLQRAEFPNSVATDILYLAQLLLIIHSVWTAGSTERSIDDLLAHCGLNVIKLNELENLPNA